MPEKDTKLDEKLNKVYKELDKVLKYVAELEKKLDLHISPRPKDATNTVNAQVY